ncbi:MAG: hypothetical protein D6800_15110, partial [Candidatus Zixiibacteriota bacterium]
MTAISLTLLTAVLLSCGTKPPAEEKPVSHPKEWYWQRYPFMNHWGRVFTFESEFDWPARYRRPDSADLSPFQFWVSHLPLWPKTRGVGSLRRGDVYMPKDISRVIDLPWRTQNFTDAAIPLQLYAEYLNWRGEPARM